MSEHALCKNLAKVPSCLASGTFVAMPQETMSPLDAYLGPIVCACCHNLICISDEPTHIYCPPLHQNDSVIAPLDLLSMLAHKPYKPCMTQEVEVFSSIVTAVS